jgi:hypothetical protein
MILLSMNTLRRIPVDVSMGRQTPGWLKSMRIKGIDPERASDDVRAALQKSIGLYGRVLTPNKLVAHRPEFF